ncbi:Protein kinase, catalytic domain-containing protein [Cynara cardunculus var. scolymus]|uniref:non-specific serine/threonine protein kinase n=1 Tax=Cynara cardunculus var. scolymus TaxID=59895 RepID=A0A103XFY1_CYNCS|nr:Protein kinase, catalytic domain-containing protein [Cynara cardunculus var. scolymus]
MASEVGLLGPENDLLAKLKLSSKVRPELEDADAVERCPNDRYIRLCCLHCYYKDTPPAEYKGFDEVEGIEIAWNQVRLDDAMQSPEHLERVYSEVHLLRTLKHENIIKSYVSWVDDEKKTINMITELFTSGSLRQYRKKHKSVDLKAIKNWARQILRGLAYLHSHDPPIIHRDLKCDNIFVNGNHGEVKIGDLGLATLMLRPTAKSLIGTPEFMAPELYEEEYNELGIKPAGLSKVKDPQVKQFIEKCLVPVSQRLPARELLKDPFLALESTKERVSEPKSILPKLNLCPMDIDCNDNKMSSGSSCVRSNNSSPRFPSIEIQCVNERNEIRLKGEKDQENSILLSLKIADYTGQVRNIKFTFYVDIDTVHSIALEMVEQLDLLHEDVAVIAQLIDDMIMKFVPAWKPSFVKSNSSGGSTSTEGSIMAQNGQFALVSSAKVLGKELAEAKNHGCKGSDNSSSTYSGDWMKSSGASSNDSCNKNMSNDSSSCLNLEKGEKDVSEDLKLELDAIDAQYRQWCSELQKFREAAIENAKKRWVSKKKVPVF